MNALLDDLAKAMAARNLHVLLIGGHALQAYGIVRQTLDIDWITLDEDIGAIKEMMIEEGFTILAQTENFLRFRHRKTGVMDIDVLLVDRKTFRIMYDAGTDYTHGTVQWRIPSPAHLIALKLHAIKNNPLREARDVADILDLIRSSENMVSLGDLRQLCRKYGAEGIYQRIEKAL
jgi:hypothetical protein